MPHLLIDKRLDPLRLRNAHRASRLVDRGERPVLRATTPVRGVRNRIVLQPGHGRLYPCYNMGRIRFVRISVSPAYSRSTA